MVEILYVKRGNEVDPKFLGIPPEQKERIEDMVKSYKEIEKNIEVRICNIPIKEEMNHDHRIRKDMIENVQDSGKALLPEELHYEYRNKKICYCRYQHNFNQMLFLIFHELNHFNNPFDIGETNRKEWKTFESLDINLQPQFFSRSLKYHIINELNECFADYKVIRQLLAYKELKNALLNNVNYNLQFNRLKKLNRTPSLESMRNIFQQGFHRLFLFLGGWRGFGKNEFLENDWENHLENITKDDLISVDFLHLLKKKLLKKKFETLEDEIYCLINFFFKTTLNYQF